MRDIETRIQIDVDDFKGREFYEPRKKGKMQTHRTCFFPYISYSPEGSSRTLFGYVGTWTDDWLMLDGVIVLIGEERYTYTLDGLELLNLRGSDVTTGGYSVSCREWVHLPAKMGDSEFAMFQAIADADDTTEVRVRAHGTDYSRDWTMRPAERRAWRDLVFYYRNFGLRAQGEDALVLRTDYQPRKPPIVEYAAPALHPKPRPHDPIKVAYPPGLVPELVEDTVLVFAVVDTAGTVSEAHIEKGSRFAALDSAALAAVQEAHFSPGEFHAQKAVVKMVVSVPVAPAQKAEE